MTMAKNTDVLRTALQQYGYTEHPAGSNNTKYGKAYGVNGVAWCAIFDWWCGEQPKGENPIAKNYNAAYIQDQTVSKKGGTWIMKKTKSSDERKDGLKKVEFGDIVDFDFGAFDAIRDHTSIAVGVSGNNYVCIEGNTSFSNSGSQSNGGCVALRFRPYTDVCSIVRPKYTKAKFTKPTTAYKGKIPALPERGYLQYGDKSLQVKRLQTAMTWANGYELKSDKVFGGKTFAEVVIFQLVNGLKPDGQFGKKSLAMLKDIIKHNVSQNAPKPPETNKKPITNTTIHAKEYTPQIGDLCYDLSNWQGRLSVDYFERIKKKGVKCIILRSSYSKLASPHRMYKDDSFDHNIKNAIKVGMHIGVYHFSSALNASESAREAEFCLSCIKPYMKYIDLPVAFDCEFGETSNARFKAKQAKALGKTGMWKIVVGFTSKIKSAGYEPMLYANLHMFNNYLPTNAYQKIKIWVAQYNTTCDYQHPYYMWQFTSNNGELDENKFGTQGAKLPKPKETNAEKVMAKAIEYAYPKGTDKSKYEVNTGKPKDAYTKALDKIFPKHKNWKKEIRNGASCSVFVSTCFRASGVDTKFMCDDPPKIIDYMAKSSKYIKQNDGNKPLPMSKLKAGDIIAYAKTGANGGGHILLYKGDGYITEANFGRCYPHTSKIPKAYLNESYIKHMYKKFVVYRVK